MATKGAIRKDVPKGTRRRTDPKAPYDPKDPLVNPKYERFACEYVKDFDGAKAYRRVYGDVKMAEVGGYKLLRIPQVRSRVEHLARTTLDQERMNAMEVLKGLARIASLDPRRAFDADGNLIPIHKLPDDVALAIAGIEVTEEFAGRGSDRELVGYTKKLKFNDRLGALRDLGKVYRILLDGEPPKPEEPDALPVTPSQTERLRERLLKLNAPVTIEA